MQGEDQKCRWGGAGLVPEGESEQSEEAGGRPGGESPEPVSSQEFNVAVAGVQGWAGQGHPSWPPATLFLLPRPPRRGPVLHSTALTLLPGVSLAICSPFLPVLPNFSLTNDKALGDRPLVGMGAAPGLPLFGSRRWRSIWAALGF